MPVAETGLNCMRKEKMEETGKPGQKLKKKYGE